MAEVEPLRLPGDRPLTERLRRPAPATPQLFWLGQAGFVLRIAGATLLLDPYLSDFLSHKYRGTLFDHVRMVPPPIAPDAVPAVDLVLCSHRHSDHMDPWTLAPLAAGHPRARFVLPRSLRDHAERIGVPPDRIVPASAGTALEPLPGVRIHPVPAAHEALSYDDSGELLHLGYVVELAGLRFYHSGDCVPYDGQAAMLAALRIDLALLPVNGRDRHRLEHGVPGNFHWDEAVGLCVASGIRTLMPHHFGMFAFNTVDPDRLDVAGAAERGVRVVLPSPGAGWQL